MTSAKLPSWLIHVAIIVGLPTIACTGFYSLDHLGEDSFLSTSTILAYPIVLIGLIGLTMVFLSPNPSRKKVWVFSLVVFIPVLFLISIRV